MSPAPEVQGLPQGALPTFAEHQPSVPGDKLVGGVSA